ncbi:hypothetical protein [Leucobacter sp. VD1]|uniref:hypothetical protein n=1 Tax=Leucobacter sp. VD1 TaxID=3080381 RepID=UPI0030159A04
MNCPAYNDRLCEIQYLLEGLSRFDQASFWSTVVSGGLAATAGAIVGGLLSYFLYRASRKDDAEVRSDERNQAADVRASEETARQHRLNVEELARFLRFHTSDIVRDLLTINKLRHFERRHPEAISEEYFADRSTKPGPVLRLKLESSAAFLVTTGKTRELFKAVRDELESSEYQSDPYKAGHILSALSVIAMTFFKDGEIAEGLIEQFRSQVDLARGNGGPPCPYCKEGIYS